MLDRQVEWTVNTKILAAWVVSVLGIPKCGELDCGPVKAEIVISATEIVFSVLLQLGWSEAL